MKTKQCTILTFVVLISVGLVMGQASGNRRWAFDQDKAGVLPAGFESYSGRWAVKADPTAPSRPNVLAQEATKETWPGVVVKDSDYGNLRVEVKFKTISGEEDQAAGIIFRAQDKGNFYLVRANANEDNVELFQFVNGRRSEIKGQNIKVPHGTWQSLGVKAVGNTITCFFNGRQLFSAKHDRYKQGKVGLWTKADSVTYFDDFKVESADAGMKP